MSEKSSPGSTPCEYRFSATLTRSRLPVRSPLPNRQPSSRSAPAITANSPAAVPVPRSLCGWTDSTMLSRRARWRCIHSIMSAKMFGVECSTVDGRLTMHLRCGVGCQTSVTASTTRLLKASSVPENISGEYWNTQSVSGLPGREFDEQPGLRGGELDDAVLVQPEHDAPHHRRGGVVEMDDRPAGAAQRLEGAADQGLARLRQHLDRHVGRDAVLVDQLAHEVVFDLRCRRKTDLDLLEADPDQRLEHAQLARDVHRLDQRLVAVAQVDAAPDRRTGEHRVGPGAVRQADAGERAVFGGRVLQHGRDSGWMADRPRALNANGPLRVQTGRRGKRCDRALPAPPVGR